ncbi:MAG: DNRLRE domain-containing protein [Clostridia bacterium]|nr:DNRLRE domain-containing protein [Clostridia bacterium]
MQTDGLVPQIDLSGRIVLYHPQNGNEIASFAPLHVFDSAPTPHVAQNCFYTLEKFYKKDTYLLSISIPESFWQDDSTVFPIYIDPTFSFSTFSAIYDASFYSGYPDLNHGANYFINLGYVDNNYGVGYELVKFHGLDSSTFFNQLSDSQINSVTYHVRNTGGISSSAIIAAYHFNNSWDEYSVTYNSANISNNTGGIVCSIAMGSSVWYSFDITSAAKAWKNGTANYGNGLILKNLTNNYDHAYNQAFAAAEYGYYVDSDFMPYVSVVFNNGSISSDFSTAPLAAYHFAKAVYSSTEYTYIEYAATIYIKDNRYYYYNVHAGEPHSVIVSNSVPSGATYVGYIHTHPNSEDFSNSDTSIADSWGGYAFVVTPSYSVKRYSALTGTTLTLYTGVAPYSLTIEEKDDLYASCYSTWYGPSHFINGECSSGFGCETKTWPNPNS